MRQRETRRDEWSRGKGRERLEVGRDGKRQERWGRREKRQGAGVWAEAGCGVGGEGRVKAGFAGGGESEQ